LAVIDVLLKVWDVIRSEQIPAVSALNDVGRGSWGLNWGIMIQTKVDVGTTEVGCLGQTSIVFTCHPDLMK
jgi:hypothetical protein